MHKTYSIHFKDRQQLKTGSLSTCIFAQLLCTIYIILFMDTWDTPSMVSGGKEEQEEHEKIMAPLLCAVCPIECVCLAEICRVFATFLLLCTVIFCI